MAQVPAEFERFTHAIVDDNQEFEFNLNSGTYAGPGSGTCHYAGKFDDPATSDNEYPDED